MALAMGNGWRFPEVLNSKESNWDTLILESDGTQMIKYPQRFEAGALFRLSERSCDERQARNERVRA